ncbi:calcium-binding protein [Xylella taiwanensis]|nr:calcium-binding protein [Xylella taiwanensis]MCD8455313.1 peptidoglycan DD-metalloendopeptidase family protein [Xylella taiwanensis]MCD8464085.1 peptidoglycan DD-metalloendopeptidase family protein [Xylella taiwanensis]MCD8464360.1 peptidoglycan DD-metalloendopeptidase family protein [Xylella taiwanensis]MCD8469579.1 peptidoglycan DD-metalloendopeptidase family protein [Xylella taiwanensis]UFS54089.1 peptidoglycan DD-metalloendopeptidase family protein [Xylella taiwanensis]
MNRMLPPQDGTPPHVTGNYRETRPGKPPHGGIDFNYQGGQTGINLTHPTIYSPISGTVTFVGGQFATIKIRDADGNSHEILHTHSQAVTVGQQINAGDPIGTMGGRGPNGINEFAQHVHYQMKDPQGRRINPQDWWDNGGSGIRGSDSAGHSNHGTGAAGGPGAGGASVSKRNTYLAPRDPLALDLDGDGIETTSTQDGTQNGRVILFDHDGDGVKTGTGWVKPDDGWLVLDRDGNGTIDSGRELFGIDTLKRNGQRATDGFDALRDEDSNQDGTIDAADSVFAHLRIWRDLNQDGVSQANELSTLADNKIISIGVNATAGRIDLGHGNVQTATGTFTRSNGTTGTANPSNGTAANLDVLADTFYRDFTQRVALTDQAKALPFLRGSGRVRDLDEAISLSSDLGNWVQAYSEQTTRQAQLERLDGLMERWVNTSDMKSLQAQADALKRNGVTLTYVLSGLAPGTAAYEDFLRKLGIVERLMGFTYGGRQGEARFTPLDAASGKMTVTLSDAQVTNIALAYERFKTDIYESLLLTTRLAPIYTLAEMNFVNGAWVTDWSGVEQALKQGIQRNPREGILDAIEFVSALGYKTAAEMGWDGIGFLTDQLNATPELGAFIKESSSWTVIFAAANEHYLPGTLGSDLLVGTSGDDSIIGEQGNDVFIGKGGNDTFDGGSGNDTYEFAIGSGVDRIYEQDSTAGNTDVVRFADVASTALTALERKGNDLVIKYGANDQLTINNYFIAPDYKVEQFKFSDGVTWDDVAIKMHAITKGDASNNFILGYNDGSNRIYGLEGDDIIYGGALADTLDGGTGNDTLNGGAGNDIYQFAIGSGVDRIEDYGGNTDVVRFADVASTALTALERKDNDLVIKYGASDQLTVSGYFYPGDSGAKIEQFKFSDGVTWDETAIKARVITKGDANNNTILGYNDGSNRIYGWDGNDAIYGGALADTLYGGAGNDMLSGNSGADLLDGGTGNDVLNGGSGNDIYQFAIGAGVDRIEDCDSTASNTDVVRFADVASTALTALERKGNDLVIRYGSSDQLTVSEYFNPNTSSYKVEQFAFSDGVTWDDAAIKARVITNGDAYNNYIVGYNDGNNRIYGLDGNDEIYGGTLADTLYGGDGFDTLISNGGDDTLLGGAGNDVLGGNSGADLLDGGTGNDTLYGDAGNDILDGGTGNDVLDGGSGNDTYRFASGSGVDRIEDYDTTAGNSDVVRFADVASTALTALERKGNDLVIRYGSSDQLTVSNYFNPYTSGYKVEQFMFSDGVTWDDAAIKARVITKGDVNNNYIVGYNDGNNRIYGLDGNDEIYGGALADTLYGGNGNDVLSGGSGADLLDGGTGNDTLHGDAGNDILDGGTGNDVLDGGSGNDTYRFASGAGVDRIYDYDTTAGNTDVVCIGPGVTTDQLWFRHVGADLEVSIMGTSDQITISNWYSDAAYHVEQFKTSDGKVLLDGEVNALVSAMAAFAPPALGHMSLSVDEQKALHPVIAAHWK